MSTGDEQMREEKDNEEEKKRDTSWYSSERWVGDQKGGGNGMGCYAICMASELGIRIRIVGASGKSPRRGHTGFHTVHAVFGTGMPSQNEDLEWAMIGELRPFLSYVRGQTVARAADEERERKQDLQRVETTPVPNPVRG